MHLARALLELVENRDSVEHAAARAVDRQLNVTRYAFEISEERTRRHAIHSDLVVNRDLRRPPGRGVVMLYQRGRLLWRFCSRRVLRSGLAP